MQSRRLCVLALLASTAACAAKTPSTTNEDGPRTSSQSRRDVITQAELTADPATRSLTVLEVVRSLRPQFLNVRGSNSLMSDPEAGLVHVSMNSGRIMPLSELSQIHANEVTEIRYLNAGQAMQKFGTAARQGPVIVVITTSK